MPLSYVAHGFLGRRSLWRRRQPCRHPVPTLLIATTNPHKLDEIHPLLAGLPLTLVGLDAHPHVADAEETGTTFAENARLKALHYHVATGLPAVAEDSGLEIDALGGAPGVLSSRYPGTTYPEKFDRLYADVEQRTGGRGSVARFVCALALARDGRIVYETMGTVEGRLAPEPAGDGGFGYDPIFYYPPYGATLAAVTPELKAAVSHRGRAFRALHQHLEAELAAW